MKCLIPGRFVKLFGRAIHCLSKIGDELYIEATADGLALRTVNTSRSAFGCFLFNESFFHEYNPKGSDSDDDDNDSEGGNEDSQKFKISMKSCLGVFKSLHTIEKIVDTCRLEYDHKETRIVFKMFCRHGITKTHNLTFQESESLQAVFSKELCPNLIVAQAKVLIDTAANFPNSCEEVTLGCTPEHLTFRNYLEDEPDPSKIVHTEMKLHPEEFDDYQIGVDTDITFCLKEARAILAFSEFVSQPVNLHFSTSGKPVVFSLDGDSLYVADFVLATLMEQQISSQASQNGQGTSADQQIAPRVRGANKKAGSRKKNKDAAAASNGQSTRPNAHNRNEVFDDIPNDTTIGDEIPVELRDVTTPDYADAKLSKRPEAEERGQNNRCGAYQADDFFSQSFPYTDMLAKRDEDDLQKEQQHSESSDISASKKSAKAIVSQRSTQKKNISANVGMPCLGDSVDIASGNEKNANNRDLGVVDHDDVLPGTPPSKRFKSIFFGTVTAPEEIKRRRKLHETVLAADTDDES